MSVSVIPYLSFEGNCEEAVRLYAEIFGGKTLYLSRWSELSAKYPAQVGKIMHVEFLVGNTRMGAGDSFDRKGTHANIKLMVHMDDPQKAADTCGFFLRGDAKSRRSSLIRRPTTAGWAR